MTQAFVPHIPEDAPFIPSQRAWLNGFLAGLYSYAPAVKPLRVALLYGSQTGTAEGLARKLAKEMKGAGFEVVLSSLEGYVPATLAAESYALFIVSTYGEGEAPDSAQPFFQQLCVEHFPLLGELSYAVLAIGDSHYEHFCEFGKHLDTKLQSLGGARILDRVDCDVELDAPFSAWKKNIRERMQRIAQQSSPDIAVSSLAPDEEEREEAVQAFSAHALKQSHTRDDPYSAPLVEKRALTHPSSSKRTIHLDFDIADSPIQYEAGDACGVVPENCPNLVDNILGLLPFGGEEVVEVQKVGSVPLREAISRYLSITRLTKSTISQYADLSQCKRLRELLLPEREVELKSYLHGRDLVDLLQQCSGAIRTPQELVNMLPRLVPRLYSISSSPAAHPGRVHTTVAVVRYQAHAREREGVCSTLLADRMHIGDCMPLYIQPNKKFRLPLNNSSPIIMIGPGTGIAPFRAFLHERQATGANGKNWLFFGERSARTDFLYRDELQEMHADGHLTRFDTAFSRDQEKKIYVQDKMLQEAKSLWEWLQEGASVYVCGDASYMAKDVDKALFKIVKEQGGLSEDDAELYLQMLKEKCRYQRDIY